MMKYITNENAPQKVDRIRYNRLLETHKQCLREKEYKCINEFESKQSQFYGLPKAHKSNIIKEKCQQATSQVVEIGKINDLHVYSRMFHLQSSFDVHSYFIDQKVRPLKFFLSLQIVFL